MSHLKTALSQIDRPVRIGYRVSQALGLRKNFRMRVLLYHGVGLEDFGEFSRQLDFLEGSWKFISPEDFELYLQGSLKLNQDSLLLTFDDGFKSQREVVERVLNPRGISAIFFIITEYAKLGSESDWRGFISKYIWPGLEQKSIPVHWQNMDLDDLNFLIETGHTIGSHSARHERLSEVETSAMSENIFQAGDELERIVGRPVKHFAYPFGDIDSFNKPALEVARSRFQFIHTGMRGNNTDVTRSWEIRRDSFEPTDSRNWLSAVLDGLVDWKYRRNLERFRSWESN
jgi:peptidoglycan/xylan/chitin deacetylase (PgdA/CDA1 family)